MAKQTTLLVALLAGCASMLPGADAAECPNTAGIVFGSIFGTLAVVAIITALVYCCCIKKKRDSRDITPPKSGSKHGQTNPSFVADVEAGPAKPVCDDKQHKELGFGGYVVCREYEGKPTHDRQRADR